MRPYVFTACPSIFQQGGKGRASLAVSAWRRCRSRPSACRGKSKWRTRAGAPPSRVRVASTVSFPSAPPAGCGPGACSTRSELPNPKMIAISISAWHARTQTARTVGGAWKNGGSANGGAKRKRLADRGRAQSASGDRRTASSNSSRGGMIRAVVLSFRHDSTNVVRSTLDGKRGASSSCSRSDMVIAVVLHVHQYFIDLRWST